MTDAVQSPAPTQINHETAEGEAIIAAAAAKAGRSCGKCSLCCLLLGVPEASKPLGKWCPSFRPGKGCGIYDQRPSVCRTYSCMGLIDGTVPDYWEPMRSKLVLDFHTEEPNPLVLRVHVHPKHPNRWREEPYYSDIRNMARAGLNAATKMGFYQTVIVDALTGKFSYLVLPDEVLPYTPGVVLRIGDDQWKRVSMKSDEEAKALDNMLTEIDEAGREIHRQHPNMPLGGKV